MRNELIIMMIAILLLALGIILSQGPRKSQDKDKQEGEVKTVTITVTTSSVWDRSKPMKEIDTSNMPYLRQGEITVYFDDQQRRLAQEVAQALQNSWQLVAKRLGIALGAFGVALIALSEAERAEIGGIYIRHKVQMQVKQPFLPFPEPHLKSPKPPFPVVVTPGLQSLKEADLKTRESIYWTMPHEALHSAVSEALESGLDRGWRFDPMTRGLEDGLAEYIGHIVTQKFDPEAHKLRLEGRWKNVQEVLQEREHPTYDLTQEFLGDIEWRVGQTATPTSRDPTPTEIAGYGVALAFWLQIAQKYGEGVIKAFWHRLSQRGFPTAEKAARILSELTGEDIWTKLQQMDLHEALRTLEQAGARG